MYSRRQRVEEKENKRKTFGFILLTIAVAVFMFYYGLPLLVKVSNFAYDLKKSNQTIERNDTTPPPPPSFSSLPESTNNNKLDIKGSTEPGSTVTLSLNGKTTEILVGNDGTFSQTFTLKEGKNSISAYAKDASGNKSQDSVTHEVTLDKTPPEISVDSPADGSTYYGSKNQVIKVQGKTEKDAQVQINDHLAVVDSSGNFSYTYSLNEGDNAITVKAQDVAGNSEETTINVKYVP